VAGGGRAVEVEPDRVSGWFDRFASRHGGVTRTETSAAGFVVAAASGATASVAVSLPAAVFEGLVLAPLLDHVLRSRRIGLLLVRLGGHSVGIATDGVVEVSRTDRRPVHGRSAAGGWSQHRFARRRELQARQALSAAADDAHEVLGPALSTLDSVVLGGDHRALDVLRTDPRLAPVFAIASPRVLDLPNPARTVLDTAARRARSIEIVVRDGFPPANR
jgi:hypothetical protein